MDPIYLDEPTPRSASSSTNSLSQEPWNKVQSSYAEKRKKMQAERMRQLKELEEQVTETANWNQKRKDLVTTTSRRPNLISEEFISPSSSTSSSVRKSSISSTSNRDSSNPTSGKIDLGDATLEDLEGLIAASAKRLASYRLRNQPLPPVKKSEDVDKWKDLIDTSSSSNLHRLSTTKHYNADPLNASSPESGEKSPSASYLRLRNMFEKDTLLSSKAQVIIDPPTSPPATQQQQHRTFTLAELATHRSNRKLSISSGHDISSGVTTTRSTMSNATPKIESPRISSSTTPRASSSYVRKPKNEPTTIETTRSRKLSTLASLQQRQRMNHHTNQQQQDIKTVDDYMNSIKKPSTTTVKNNSFEEPQVKRKVKLSITTTTSPTVVLSGKKISNIKPTLNASTTTGTVVRRKRGKVH